MRLLIKIFLVFFIPIAFASEAKKEAKKEAEIANLKFPVENQQKGDVKAIRNFNSQAKRIFESTVSDDADAVKDTFISESAFAAIKDMPGSAAYYSKLTNWYKQDLKKEHERLKGLKDLKFDSFKLGFCKWKAAGSEYNKIPYWSCYKSQILAKTKDKTHSIAVKVMINWGEEWYVTHLGPIPKN